MSYALRPYQEKAIADLRGAVARGERRIMLQQPTGGGKTIIAAEIVELARKRNNRVLFTVPAISLVDQTVERFYAHGIHDIGVIQADHHMTDWSQPVQIASVQTLMRRQIPEAQVVMIDEAHILFEFYGKWFCDPAWEKVPIIGLSATPYTRGLGRYFRELIRIGTTESLIEQEVLTPFRVFAPPVRPNLRGVHTRGGDYVEEELSERMVEPALVADVVETWQKLASGMATLCYAVDRAHAKHLQAKFEAAGISCGYQDAHTKGIERAVLKQRFHQREIKVVVSVGTLVMGIDWLVECISFCRPTKSHILFQQIIGRGLRPAPNKKELLILDHSDNHLRLGFVTDVEAAHDDLDDGEKKTTDKERRIPLPKECPQCSFLKPPKTAKCPVCGFVAQVQNAVEEDDGELRELPRRHRSENFTMAEKAQFFAELKALRLDAIANGKNYKEGWPSQKYRAKFGVWPDPSIKHIAPAAFVSASTLSWVRSQNIAWRNSKRRTEWENGGGARLNGGNPVAVRPQQPQRESLMTTADWDVDL